MLTGIDFDNFWHKVGNQKVLYFPTSPT